jgi:hypothetical protein
MPLERQKLTQGIQSGNFGQAGVPLASKPQSGPDYGRLLSSLGVIAGKAAEEKQAVNVDAAAAAIREATLDTKTKKKGMTKADHREWQAHTINSVRNQFEDQGAFLDIFAGENKAIQTIDKFNGRAKALESRSAMRRIMESTKGQPLEEREAQLMAVMQSGMDFTDSISTKSKESYLEAITEQGLANADELLSDQNAQVLFESKQSITNTSELELYELAETMGGFALEDSNRDPAAFASSQSNLDQIENVEALRKAVSAKGQETYESLSQLGSRQEASQGAADSLIRMAIKMNRPEILDSAEDIKLPNGNTLQQQHGIQLEKAKGDLQDSWLRKQAAFRDQAASNQVTANNQHYTGTLAPLQAAVSNAQLNLDDSAALTEAFTAINTTTEDFDRDRKAGVYKGNEAHATRMSKMLTTQRLTLESSFGDQTAESIILGKLANRTLTQDEYNQYAHRLGPATKKQAYIFIQPEIAAAKEQISDAETAKKNIYKDEINSGMQAVLTAGQLGESTQLAKSGIELIDSNDDVDLPVIDTQLFQSDYKLAQNRTALKFIEEEGRLPTAEEMIEATQPVVERYGKIYEERKKIIDKSVADIVAKKEEAKKKAEDAARNKITHYDKLVGNENTFSSPVFTEKEIHEFYDGRDAGLLDHLTEAEMGKAMQNAVVQEMRSGRHNISEAVSLFTDRFGSVDLDNPEHRKFMGNAISEGLDDSFFSDIISTTVMQGAPTTLQQGDTSTDRGITKNLLRTLFVTPLEAVGLVDTPEDELRRSMMSGEFFTPTGIQRLKKKYPNTKQWGNIDRAIKKLMKQ